MSRAFSQKELSQYNGLHGKPAYLGYKGKVYDVSGVFKNGEHAGVKAGQDITQNFSKGPHQEDIFSKFPMVGTLASDQGFWGKVFNVSNDNLDLILRLGLGLVFSAHGAQKLLGWFGGYGWDGTMGFLTQTLNVPSSLAAIAILTEFFGGLAILLGLLTRPAALGLAITMLVAIFKVHLVNGFFLDQVGPKDGIEFAFILLFVSLYFVVKGAGQISLDKLIHQQINR